MPERNLAGEDRGDRLCLSHSRLTTFLGCQQKYAISHEHKLAPKTLAEPLELGAAFAHATEHGDPEAGYDMIMRETCGIWRANEEVRKKAVIVQAASKAYLLKYGSRERREVAYRLRLRNPQTGEFSERYDVQARLDGLDGNVVIEDKFKTRVPQAIDRQLKLDRQITIQGYLHWRVTGNLVERFNYRITKKPAIRQGKKEALDKFLSRIEEEYSTLPDKYLFEFNPTRTEADYLRVEEELWDWAGQIERVKLGGVYPRNTGYCTEFGGCEFLAVCNREPGWEALYKEKEYR